MVRISDFSGGVAAVVKHLVACRGSGPHGADFGGDTPFVEGDRFAGSCYWAANWQTPEQAVAVTQRLGLDLSRCLLHREAHRQGLKAQVRRSQTLAQLDTWEDLQQLAHDTQGPPTAPFTLVIEIDAFQPTEKCLTTATPSEKSEMRTIWFDLIPVVRVLISARMVRLVLFDIDGTLLHTGGAGVKAFAKVFETEFNAIDGFHGMKFAGRTDVSLVREFFQLNLIPPSTENFARFFERYVFWLDEMLRHGKTVICPGVLEFIRDLKALPEPPVLGLLTGNIRLGAEIKLRQAKLWDEFETGGFADDHELRDQIAAAARDRGSRLMGREPIVFGMGFAWACLSGCMCRTYTGIRIMNCTSSPASASMICAWPDRS